MGKKWLWIIVAVVVVALVYYFYTVGASANAGGGTAPKKTAAQQGITAVSSNGYTVNLPAPIVGPAAGALKFGW